jgi:hypothetical protein
MDYGLFNSFNEKSTLLFSKYFKECLILNPEAKKERHKGNMYVGLPVYIIESGEYEDVCMWSFFKNHRFPLIYVIGEFDASNVVHSVKIGISTTSGINNRLSSIQTGNSKKIKLLHTAIVNSKEDSFLAEKNLHNFFKDSRINGEWFSGGILNKCSMKSLLDNIGDTDCTRFFCKKGFLK